MRRRYFVAVSFLLGLLLGAVLHGLSDPLHAFRSSAPLRLKHDTGMIRCFLQDPSLESEKAKADQRYRVVGLSPHRISQRG